MARFGELLAELRADHKMTQKDLANILFVTPGTISNYEKGIYYPDVEKLIQLADFFRVSTDYLLGRTSIELSVDIFQAQFTKDKTVGDVIKSMQHMSLERRKALLVVLRDMEVGSMVNKIGQTE